MDSYHVFVQGVATPYSANTNRLVKVFRNLLALMPGRAVWKVFQISDTLPVSICFREPSTLKERCEFVGLAWAQRQLSIEKPSKIQLTLDCDSSPPDKSYTEVCSLLVEDIVCCRNEIEARDLAYALNSHVFVIRPDGTYYEILKISQYISEETNRWNKMALAEAERARHYWPFRPPPKPVYTPIAGHTGLL